jgi:tetratricopeptide (TPR) repeat protein
MFALGFSLLTSPTLRAGLYNTAEPVRGPRAKAGANSGVEAMGFTPFRELLTDLSSIGNEVLKSSFHKHYLEQRDELLAKTLTGSLTTEEVVNLSEYLIRLRDYEKAVELLTPVATRERRNFMVFANLATAHQLAGRLDRAMSYLQQVKDYWPKEWPGFSTEQLNWYHEAERFHLRLVRLRYRESLQPAAARGKTGDSLDALFDGDKGAVRFVGDSGAFEAGKMTTKERGKLPDPCVALVQQLLIWIPGPGPGMEDPRLFWLLGELYNADGDIDTAAQIFRTLVWSNRLNAPELLEHRKIIQAALPEPTATPNPENKSSVERPAWLPDSRKLVLVGGVAGLVVVGFIYLQIREFRKRRKSA